VETDFAVSIFVTNFANNVLQKRMELFRETTPSSMTRSYEYSREKQNSINPFDFHVTCCYIWCNM